MKVFYCSYSCNYWRYKLVTNWFVQFWPSCYNFRSNVCNEQNYLCSSWYSRTNKYWTLFKSKWLIFSIKIKMILYKNFGISLLVGAPSDSSKGELDLVFYNIIFLYKFSSQNTFARLTLPFVKNMSLYL